MPAQLLRMFLNASRHYAKPSTRATITWKAFAHSAKNAHQYLPGDSPKAQSISKTRPSRFVILSASEGSLAAQRSFARAQDDKAASAWFDWQRVFFEMDWPKGGTPQLPVRTALLHRQHLCDMFHNFLRDGL